MRRAALGLATLVALIPLASCSGGGDDDAYVLDLSGSASVVSDDGTERLESGSHRLSPGDTVEVTDGSALLGLPGDSTLELRAGRPVRAAQATRTAPGLGGVNSTVRVGSTPTLLSGDALLVSPDADGALRAGSATIRLTEGAARVRRSTGTTVGVYEGRARVSALGRTLPGDVPAFRQAAVTDAGTLPRRAAPLAYDRQAPDPWDVRFLAEAIDLADQLERRSRSLTSALPADVDADRLATLVPALESQPGFDGSLLEARRSVGETVVGASIALGGDGDFVGRWRSAFRFRQEGADWGLVALDQQARRQAMFDVLDSVLDATTVLEAAPSGGGGAGLLAGGPFGSPGTTLVPSPAPPSSPSPDPSPSPPGPGPGPTLPPALGPPPTIPPAPAPLLGPTGKALGGILEGLLGDGDGGDGDGTSEGLVPGLLGGLLSPLDALLGPTGS